MSDETKTLAEKIAIVGSRSYPNMQAVRDYVNSLPDGTTIVSGGARGVDSTAEETAKARGLETIIYRPNWSRHGRQAGYLRNQHIIAEADKVVAFWDGQSRGTQHSIKIARAADKPVEIIEEKPE